MGLGKYLAAGLLAGAAFLYSPSLHAEDTQQKVTFNDSAAQARKTPGRNLEGRLSVSASRDKSKLVLEISAEGCEIRTGFSEFYIGLPAESEIAKLKQTAKIKESTQDGRGEEKWIDLYPVNELVEKGIFKAADYVADKIKVPVLTELLIDKVEKTKAARIQEWYKQMKKKGLFMEELSADYPKIPSAHETTIARRYEIILDVEPTKVPEARMQVCLQDQYERNITINDISVKFDGKSKMQQPQAAKPNLPAGLEKFLLDDPDLKLVKFWTPKEISAATKDTFQDFYLVKYEYSKSSVNIPVAVLIMNTNELDKKADEHWNKIAESLRNLGAKVDEPKPKDTYQSMIASRIVKGCIGEDEFMKVKERTGLAVIILDPTDYTIGYIGNIPSETLDAWQKETDPKKREANERTAAEFKNKLTRLRDSLKQKSEIKEQRIEEYFERVQKYLAPQPERTGPMEHVH